MVRSAMVTGPHLTTYSTVKEMFIHRKWLEDAPPLHMAASLAGAFAGISCNHPLDLVRNRLYVHPIQNSTDMVVCVCVCVCVCSPFYFSCFMLPKLILVFVVNSV